MRAGDLDRCISILRRTKTGVTPHNEDIVAYQEVHSIWATLITAAGDERFASDQRFASTSATFRTRFFDDLEATDRIECEGLTYDVVGWRQVGRRAGLEIFAVWREGAP